MDVPARIGRRCVFYVEGYDPQGVDGYYGLFRREHARFLKLWPVESALSPATIDPDGHAARWTIETAAPNWHTSVEYEFLNWDDIIARDLKRSMPWRYLRALAWLVDDLGTGTSFRIFRASWRFGLFYIYPLVALALWLALSVAVGWSASALAVWLGVGDAIAAIAGIVIALATFLLLRRPIESGFAIQLNDLWLFFRDLEFGRRRDFEERVDRFAERVVAAARTGRCDEIVVVGHSGGAVAAALVVARGFALDPTLGGSGPRLVLLTLGAITPAVAMHPRAVRLREILRELACRPGLVWIDCQSRKDVVNFFNFDPVAGVGIDVGAGRRNPQVLAVRFRDALAPETYARFRWNLFRIHFQFIMANDRRAAYDYILYLCGPVPLEQWALRPAETLAAFGANAALNTDRQAVPT
jgi:hypothetical protein